MGNNELAPQTVGLGELEAFKTAPATGALSFGEVRGQENPSLFFDLECADCPTGVKRIAVAAGMTALDLATAVIDHRGVHDEIQGPMDPYAAELLASLGLGQKAQTPDAA